MRFRAFFFLLLLTCLYLSLAQGSYENCCLKLAKRVRVSTRKAVVRYWKQEADGGCNIAAILFIKKDGEKFCADPKQKWAQRLVKAIDRRRG